MSEADLLITGVKIAAPMIINNHKIIIDRIKQGYRKFSKNDSILKGSVYLTLFVDFKANYPIESVNHHVCQVLKNHRIGKNECQHKYNKTTFSIIRQFNYSDYFYAPDNFMHYEETSPFENEIDIQIPLVNGISFYIFPDDDSKAQLMDGYTLTEFIEKELMKKYDINQSGLFIYVQFESDNDLTIFMNSLNKKLKSANLSKIHNLSKKENELKLKNDPLIAKILEEVL